MDGKQKMQSLYFAGRSRIEFIERDLPELGPGEVLVKTAVSALCGSEMGCYRSEVGQMKQSGNPGHEAAGTVCAAAADVTFPAVGQRVGLSAIAGCSRCEFCRRGEYTWCHHYRFYNNMHSEYIRIAANACHPLPEWLDWKSAVLISGDGLGVPWHSAGKILQSAPDLTLAVFGVGPIGLGTVLLQSHSGRRVIAVDRSEERLEIARSLGAWLTLNPSRDNLEEEIRARTGGEGADVCFEAAGRPETARMCFRCVRTGGQVIFNGEQGEVPFSVSEDFIRRDISATGSWFYHFHEFSNMLEAVRNGFPAGNLVSHVLPFASAPEAYALFAAGKTAKVLLSYEK